METLSQAQFRPAQPPKATENHRGFAFSVFVLALAVYWALIPIWPVINTEILGDADTDAIRGMWGFDHLRRSMLPPNSPLWSNQINFPAGVLVLTLPWTTGILLSPLGFLFGPVVAWNLSLALILLGLGLATAWMARQLTNSWTIGTIVGGLVMTQPMLLHAISDGTPEHLSLWGVPLLLGSTWKAFRYSSPRYALFAGMFAILVALDSPYHAIYAALIGIIVLPWSFFRRWNIEQRLDFSWTIGILSGICGLGAIFVIGLYQFFPLGETSPTEYLSLWKMNAADLRTWWQHDFQNSVIRETGLSPTTIPMPLLWFCIICIIIGLPHSLTWGFAGIIMLTLSLGLNEKLPIHLSYWIGSWGYPLGGYALDINSHLYALPGLGEIRFPQRWLVPAALSFAMGSSYGLKRIFSYSWMTRFEQPIAIICVTIATFLCVRSSQIDLRFPKQELPYIQFASYLAEQPESGGLIMLPQMRPPPPSGKRSDLPVFANLGDSLSSADVQYFQTIHGKAIIDKPSLKTLYSFSNSEYILRLVREWDDLAHPMVTGNVIPASAYDERFNRRRRKGLDELMTAGLRWVVIDLGAYNEQALGILQTQLEPFIEKKEYFNEGDGVLIFTLQAKTQK